MSISRRFGILLVSLLPSIAAAQTAWVDHTSTPHPAWLTCAAHDPIRDRTVAFYLSGGVTAFEFDGTVWTQLDTSSAPPISSIAAGRASWHPIRGVFVITITTPAQVLQTWEWDRVNWTLRSTMATPIAMHDLAWHAASGRLFGITQGEPFPNHLRVRLWEYVAPNWVARSIATAHGIGPQLEYDATRANLLATWQGAGTGIETWRYDLVSWTQEPVAPVVAPFFTPAWDSTHARMLALVNDFVKPVYELLPTGWERRQHGHVPPDGASYGHAFVHLPAVDRMVFVQNQPFHANRCATWTYRHVDHFAPAYAPSGPGCAGSNGVPSLGLANGTMPVLGTTFTIEVGALPAVAPLVMLWIGFDDRTWNGVPLPVELSIYGMPGCHCWLRPEFAMPLAVAGAHATADCPLPFDLDLLGGRFFHQALVVDPSAGNPAGAVVSNGIAGVVGW